MAATQTTPAERRQDERRQDRPERPDRQERQDRSGQGRQEPPAVKNGRRLAIIGAVTVATALLLTAQLYPEYGRLSWIAIVIAAGVLVPLAWNNSYRSSDAMWRSIGLFLLAFVAAAVWFHGIIQMQHSLLLGVVCLMAPVTAFGLFQLAGEIRRRSRQSAAR
jgi:hypothetical protein